QAESQSTGSVSGSLHDVSGAPVAGATIAVRGPKSYYALSDAKGNFTVSSIAPGLYEIIVTKPGYQTATDTDYTVVAGQSQSVVVTMHAATFSSLRTIATVRAVGRGTFNTTPAAVNVVSAAAYANQGAVQVTRVLSQVPGVQISFPSSGANAAVPGAITVPDIRGAGSFETATLIDGHPLSVGTYGDYVTTFLNAYMFSNTEVVKGPGATVPVNYAIGGTLNFRTKDPTFKPTPDIALGVTNHGGTFSNFGLSDTVSRLGFVFDVATLDDPSALNNTQVYYDPTVTPTYDANTNQRLTGFNGTSLYSAVPGTSSYIQTSYPLVACCYNVQGQYSQTAELVKFRYKFSDATTATVSYLGSQTFSDQNGNTGNLTLGSFAPLAGYTGSLAAGGLGVNYLHTGGTDQEINNEPIMQAEVRSTLGRDTVLARYYHASILRQITEGNPNGTPALVTQTLYGSSCPGKINNNVCSAAPIFYNGTPVTLSVNSTYLQTEQDALSGISFLYLHPIGSNTLSFGIDQTVSTTTSYSIGSFTNVNLPTGSAQKFTTFTLRGHFRINPKLSGYATLYDNVYNSTYPISCPFSGKYNACAIDGSNEAFASTTNTHFDDRFALTYRPNSNTVLRFAAGSAIAPPYLLLLSQISGPVANYSSSGGFATLTQNNGSLKPETSFGYDLGASIRFPKIASVLTADLYQTNLFNKYFSQGSPSPYTCASTQVRCYNGGSLVVNSTPVFYESNINLSNARFQGLELGLRSLPHVGLGYKLEGDLSRGYVYNLPQYFYCSKPGPNCTQNQNLNVIANQNFNGGGIGYGSTIGSMNTRLPYAQANLELNYRTANGVYAALGDTLYGNNNSLNRAPFGIGYVTLRMPINKRFDVQISGDNIFNTYNGLFPVYGGGVPVPLVNGSQAATVGNVLGPATYRFILTTKF
ncbi:MAG: TonB-dependent receptor, partial [Candidatus Eremiobacteraeota bacterium]|nr:TonB-dependent receptor [Candidatus Eremiobacteraeota bacterium]